MPAALVDVAQQPRGEAVAAGPGRGRPQVVQVLVVDRPPEHGAQGRGEPALRGEGRQQRTQRAVQQALDRHGAVQIRVEAAVEPGHAGDPGRVAGQQLLADAHPVVVCDQSGTADSVPPPDLLDQRGLVEHRVAVAPGLVALPEAEQVQRGDPESGRDQRGDDGGPVVGGGRETVDEGDGRAVRGPVLAYEDRVAVDPYGAAALGPAAQRRQDARAGDAAGRAVARAVAHVVRNAVGHAWASSSWRWPTPYRSARRPNVNSASASSELSSSAWRWTTGWVRGEREANSPAIAAR